MAHHSAVSATLRDFLQPYGQTHFLLYFPFQSLHLPDKQNDGTRPLIG
ncbi:MAG: hypothetical protein ABWZ39_00280 [Pseudomonas caspiana]